MSSIEHTKNDTGLLLVDVQEAQADAQAFLKSKGADLPLMSDPQGTVAGSTA